MPKRRRECRGYKGLATHVIMSASLTEEQKAKVVRLYHDTDSPCTIGVLAKRFSVSRGSILKALNLKSKGVPCD